MKTTRRTGSTFERAEAAFKAATTKPVEAPPTATKGDHRCAGRQGNGVAPARQRAVLAHFQEDGPGWQDRINAALAQGGGA
jgi:uncharacterized protein (DUF4415 family)